MAVTKIRITESDNYKEHYADKLSSESKAIIKNVRNACKQMGELLYKNQDIFGYTDAKLYDVAHYADEKDLNREWEWFLDDMWINFKEYCNEHNLEIVPVRSSNSKFYIRSASNNSVNVALDEIDNYLNKGRYSRTLSAEELGDWFITYYWGNELNKLVSDIDYIFDDNKLNEYIDWLVKMYGDATTTGIDIANDEIYENWSDLDVIEKAIPVLNEIIAGYKYGKDFKDSQLDIWNDYIASNEY